MLKIPDPVKLANVRPEGLVRPTAAAIAQPRLRPVHLMYDREHDRWGVTYGGGRFVCQLPAGYNRNCGILPHDGKLIVTLPGLPTLIADPSTGVVRRQ